MPTTGPCTPCPASAGAFGAHVLGVVLDCHELFTGGKGPQAQG
ncbi:hypothetical protein Desaf_2540 [Desulfocurvibacter africanus subsp. africanus str. Walvis Bay]|uniref:Uncharacterized protein n=1 Tax=Desulfocurvibacter africanus subsp. africanus str. Walvis Bay TaxID=690850 RepID=F3YZA6_DESAF|nr:hypothetical protein Desaf_2540 [Desulfocurvibacter africanus subsp. africanus str. Walvis Bay]